MTNEIQISKKGAIDALIELTKTLRDISILFGFKLPEDKEIVQEIAKDIITEFGSLTIPEIKIAFRMAAKGILSVDLESFGKILTITMLDKVLRSYRQSKSIEHKRLYDRENRKELPPPGLDIKNINARLKCLYDFRDKDKSICALHYDVIDNFIYQFTNDEKKEAIQKAKIQEESRIKSKIPIKSKELFAIKDQMNKIEELSIPAAKKILAKRWLNENRDKIDYQLIRNKIIETKN